jgi:hypothetical protein
MTPPLAPIQPETMSRELPDLEPPERPWHGSAGLEIARLRADNEFLRRENARLQAIVDTHGKMPRDWDVRLEPEDQKL